ncbi:MAG: DUF3829 domain-containing protein [Deltaproteobacteria bacterium]|nr:DUF3829 domain-containing protein [Deltaproteobacteria bacterium]
MTIRLIRALSQGRVFPSWLAVGALAAAMLPGCKKEGPPAPPAEESPAQGSSAAARPKPPGRLDRAPIARISPQAMKAYRLDSCYFGTAGLLLAREAYRKSLGTATPGPGKIPAFGDYEREPEEPAGADAGAPGADAGAKGANAGARDVDERLLPGRLGRGLRLPFTRHVRSCTIAKGLKQPPAGELDEVVQQYERFVTQLDQRLNEAKRYYADKRYETDQFEQGKKLHASLAEAFASLDAERDKLGAALDAWRAKAEPATDELSEGAKIAQRAVAGARSVVTALLVKKLDRKAAGELTDALAKTVAEVEAYRDAHPDDFYCKKVAPDLGALVAVAKKLQAKPAAAGLDAAQIYRLTSFFLNVVESNHIALARLVRGHSGGSPGDILRLRQPRVRPEMVTPHPGLPAERPAEGE